MENSMARIGDQLVALFGNESVWQKIQGGGEETFRLNMDIYTTRYPHCPIFPPHGENTIIRAGSKTTGTIQIEALRLVQDLMHQVKWRDLFPCLIADELPYIPEREQRHAVIGSHTIQETLLLEAAFQVLSPLVKNIGKSQFLRTCRKLEGDKWLVFDFPHGGQGRLPYVRACWVRNSHVAGFSNVTWIVLENLRHGEVGSSMCIGGLYLGVLEKASTRWFETLDRECARHAFYSHGLQGLKGLNKNVHILAQRMTRNFCLGIASATPHFNNIDNEWPYFQKEGVYFGRSSLNDENQGDRYMTAVMSARVNGAYNDVWNHIKSYGYCGSRIFQIPSHETNNFVGLYGPDHEHSFLMESLKDASGAILVYASVNTKILTKTIKKENEKDDLVINPIGYVVYPEGNADFSLVTYARQLYFSPENLQLNIPNHILQMRSEELAVGIRKMFIQEINSEMRRLQEVFRG